MPSVPTAFGLTMVAESRKFVSRSNGKTIILNRSTKAKPACSIGNRLRNDSINFCRRIHAIKHEIFFCQNLRDWHAMPTSEVKDCRTCCQRVAPLTDSCSAYAVPSSRPCPSISGKFALRRSRTPSHHPRADITEWGNKDNSSLTGL